jgi:opacity protein-like surface antigen
LLFGVQAGVGAANVTTRIKDSDIRLSDKWHFDSSAGVSFGVRAWLHSTIAVLGEYRYVITDPDPTSYFDTQLEVTIPLIRN